LLVGCVGGGLNYRRRPPGMCLESVLFRL
jgi:hypothetical protein